MTIKEDYFRYLDHIGKSVPMRELAAHPEWSDVIGLRHDIDHDLDLALEMAHYEHQRGIRATYFLLHTCEYWNDPRLSLKCAQLTAYGHEIGLHLNLLTEWFHGRCDAIDSRLRQVLAHLRSGGIDIVGTSAHGDRACYEHGFINYWIWEELRGDQLEITERGLSAEGIPVGDPKWQLQYPKTHRLQRDDGAEFALWSVSLADHGLSYDAVHIPNARYWTDTGGDWNRSADPLKSDLSKGRHQILVHPHWWRGPKRTYFVLSTARTGSKWLVNFVDQATSCCALHEWTLNHRRTDDGYELDKRTGDDFMGLVESQNVAVALIRQAAAHHRSILPGDVLEANVYLPPFLSELRNEAHEAEFIHLHRDGRDVVRSILNRGWYDTPMDRRHLAIPIAQWDELNQFERACWYYRHTQETLMGATETRISFERMVSDREYLTRTLGELGLVIHPLLAQDQFDQRIDPNATAEFPDYEHWGEDYQRSFERICGQVQEALGYAQPGTSPAYEIGAIGPERLTRNTSIKQVLTVDYTSLDAGPVKAVHVNCVQRDSGLEVCTTEAGHANASVLLGRGKWDRVKFEDGCVCDQNVFYSAHIGSSASPSASVRVFLLFFDRQGALVAKRQVATLRSEPQRLGFAFSALPEASHFMLGLHFGDRSPEQRVTIHNLVVNAITPAEDYRLRIPGARTSGGEKAVVQSTANVPGVEDQ